MRPFPLLFRFLRLRDSEPRLWMFGIVPMGLVSVLFALAVAYYLFSSHLTQQKMQLHSVGNKAVATFDHEMFMRAYSVIAMRKMAQQYMTGRSRLNMDPTRYLRYLKNQNGYTMDLPPGYGVNEIGNITGAGPIPASGSLKAREMAMTIGLMPLFQTLTTRDVDTPWIYYTSKSRFTHIYPRASIKEFFYTDKSLDYDVFKMALPEHNPQCDVFWTPPYLDEAGKGMMVTVAAPVYQGDLFLGTVALDITLSKLALLLKHFETPQYRVFLYSEKGEFLAGPVTDLGFRPAECPPNSVTERGNSYVINLPLDAVPWRILVVSSRHAMFNNAFWYAFPFALVVAFLFGSVMLLITLVRTLRKAKECSIRDGLTDLYNRRHFDAIASRELTSARRDGQYFGLIMLDIDHFKIYNDTYGHQAGDKILKEVSHILTSTLKRPMDQAFRVGGEEFAVLTKADRPEQIDTFGKILLDAIEQGNLDFPVSKPGIITVSVGVATINRETDLDMDALYALSDRALYRAKEEGRNRVVSLRV